MHNIWRIIPHNGKWIACIHRKFRGKSMNRSEKKPFVIWIREIPILIPVYQIAKGNTSTIS
ncbi:conserved hypothetical protein [delta proteobacterium NaphS2]|nr:conserved hypothetical protein [delta proteobacterium NaphS2]